MKRLFCLLLALVFSVLPAYAFGAARMPEYRGSVNDAADVLSAQTAEDLGRFSKLVTQETDLDLHVATVHFLDGLEPQTYAEQLFAKWQLTQEDVLLLGAAGEDSFAVAMGAEAERVLGRSNADNLLYLSSEFGELFRTQQYDAAVAAWCTGLNNLLLKQTGDSVRMDGLFGKASAPAAPKEAFDSSMWRDVMDAIHETTVDYHTHSVREEREENGLTAGGWIVLIILIMIVLRQNKHDRARRQRSGCSPLGWILRLFGLSFLFRRD